jgi:hypothetical protein
MFGVDELPLKENDFDNPSVYCADLHLVRSLECAT